MLSYFPVVVIPSGPGASDRATCKSTRTSSMTMTITPSRIKEVVENVWSNMPRIVMGVVGIAADVVDNDIEINIPAG